MPDNIRVPMAKTHYWKHFINFKTDCQGMKVIRNKIRESTTADGLNGLIK
ncbi:hypothetical protein [Candidatus Mycoplasma mahonii]|nr:hypothetical protein [Candidatus Mycoplasma mahonii]WKX02291.1 hypothetical protein O3I44_02705 [Candidatus Mycoplasma mahonii]